MDELHCFGWRVALLWGLRRSWREMLAPLAIFAAIDYVLTVYYYHFAFHLDAYIPTWAWYIAVMALGQTLLKAPTTFERVAAGALLGPTSFFVISNYVVWAQGGLYPHTLAGLQACYVAAIPFYRNDLASTSIVLGNCRFQEFPRFRAAAHASRACTDGAGGKITVFIKLNTSCMGP